MTTLHPFPHHKLDAYHRALDLVCLADRLAAAIPRGHRSLADQLLRAATSVALNLSEGANRLTSGEKRACFSIDRGECGEAAAAAEIAAALRLVPASDAEQLVAMAGRVGAMLTGLIQRHR